MGRFDTFIGTRRDESGAQMADLRAGIAGKQEETAQITATTVEVPVVDGTFTPIFSKGKKKNKVYVTLRFANFGTARNIKVVLVSRATIVTSDDYDNLRIAAHLTEEISDDAIAVQLVTSPLDALLDPNTQYDIIRLVAVGADEEERAINPTPDPTFAAYPGNVLFTFTTPEAFNVPSSPSLSLIRFNRRDPLTKEDDAEMAGRIHAPLTDGGAAQTYAAAGMDEVVMILVRVSDSVKLPFSRLLDATELTQVDAASSPVNRGYVDITAKGLAPSESYQWTKNKGYANGEAKESSGSAVSFTGAGEGTDPSLLTSVSATITTSGEPFNGDGVSVALNFTQPSTPISLKHVTVERKLSSESDSVYPSNVIIPKYLLKDDSFHTVGAHTGIVLDAHVKTKPSRNYVLRFTITALSGSQYQFTQAFSTGADGSVATDTAAPSGLATPILEWTSEGKLRVRGLVATTDIHTLKKKYLVLYDGTSSGSTKFFDFANRVGITGISNEASARFEFGLKSHIPFPEIKLKKYTGVFGTSSPTNVYAYWYAENDVGVSSKSSDSAAFDLFTAYDFMGSRDTVRGLDVEATMTSPANILGNGACLLIDAGTDEQNNWARWDGLTTPLPAIGSGTGSGAYRTIKSTSNDIAYVSSSHALWLKSGTAKILLQNVKQRFQPGDAYNITFAIRAASSITVTIKLHMYNLSRAVLTGTADATSSTAVHAPGGAFLIEVAIGDEIVISSQKRTVTNVSSNTDLTVSSAFSGASGAMNLIIDNINNKISQSVNLTTANQLFGAVFKMKDSPNLASTAGGADYTSHHFGIEITSNSDDIFYDKFMLPRGEQPMQFAPRGNENDTGTIGVVPTYIAPPDIVEISGIPGGWKGPDSGGIISIS